MRTELGDLSDLEALQRVVNISGLSLIEAGCAAGDTARRLAELGARVLAVEPDKLQAEKNRAAPAVPGVTFVEAGAEALPAEDASMDGVLFFRSLHHVPRDLMGAALIEATRVLKPDGFLYVAEPGMEGSHFTMMRPFNDEFEVRTLAQQALGRSARPNFEETARYVYMQRPRHESFDAMVTKFSSLSYNPIARELIEQDDVRNNFEAGKTADGYVFEQPMLINFHRGVRGRN
ncbi:MAG: class I SAM-dependent methyltransferase [Proteobacteria bacterium]|nr:class I SAM-dependent methyltransferase [Pseudomonadota bacterium]MDA1356454.1 class I SAM-dependent methyltransferase [Pseudomonadota bacterium]